MVIGIRELPEPAGNANARAVEINRREREQEIQIEELPLECYVIS